VFSAGYSMKKRPFFNNFGTIVTFAVVGTVISTVVFSFCTILLMWMGIVDVDKIGESPGLKIFLYGELYSASAKSDWSLGSLISATDPVATLSVFSDMNAPPLLYNLVFGESVLNDAVAIVLFNTFEHLSGKEIHWWTFFVFVLQFLWNCCGSILVGVAVSAICAFILKNFNPRSEDGSHSDGTMYEISIVLMGSYMAYLVRSIFDVC